MQPKVGSTALNHVMELELDIAGKKLSADKEAADNFAKTFKTEKKDSDSDLNYNSNETGLNCKVIQGKG